MKTKLKNIKIEFSLNLNEKSDLRLELSENAHKTVNSFVIQVKGILMDGYNKNLRTQIIIIN